MLESKYNHKKIEENKYNTWLEKGYFRSGDKEKEPYVKLYEENIGPLTPMIADVLRDSEKDYPYEWIRDAVEEAVMNNVRSWRDVESILKNWKENGQHGSC